ncbi:PIG-L deacetylase family protein [Alloiococcus sp. CFN-8]|uniref:PIG-L deacetylase family protein n=1 Tax=Alloiococcus sp. CFN-8 TaxID=3416081 RepID=UPI003CF1A27E
MEGKKVLVFSAHAADYVWRAGGTIAKYIKHGADVTVIVMSYGVRGESNDLWKMPDQTVERVKAIRHEESSKAAEKLGVKNIEFWDLEDYPFPTDREVLDRITRTIREKRPDIILTHDKKDVINPDHDAVRQLVFQGSIMSNSAGVVIPGLPVTKQMMIFGFEPHQTEISDFKPGTFIDITESYEAKLEAMRCFKAQNHLIEYYTQRAFLRGNHARRLSGVKEYKYAECFANFFPRVAEEF